MELPAGLPSAKILWVPASSFPLKTVACWKVCGRGEFKHMVAQICHP
jgi:hypothetical protein